MDERKGILMSKVRWLVWSLVALLILAGITVLSGGQEPSPVAAQGEGIELAVYNQNLALVKDLRSMDLIEGVNEVRFGDVAELIDSTSVHFRSLTDPEGTVSSSRTMSMTLSVRPSFCKSTSIRRSRW